MKKINSEPRQEIESLNRSLMSFDFEVLDPVALSRCLDGAAATLAGDTLDVCGYNGCQTNTASCVANTCTANTTSCGYNGCGINYFTSPTVTIGPQQVD